MQYFGTTPIILYLNGKPYKVNLAKEAPILNNILVREADHKALLTKDGTYLSVIK